MLFSTHGIPEQIVSDNGPQLTSKEFENYCQGQNIEHIFTPPYHPNSNGEAERFVQTFKKTLEKGTRGGMNLEEAICELLLQYRATPHPATGVSPAQMLMGRQLRLKIDAVPALTQEKFDPEVENRYRETMKRNHDKVSRERSFVVGEAVYMQNPQPQGDRWLNGRVISVLGENRYTVHYGYGQRQCHANQLKKSGIRWEDYEDEVVRKRLIVKDKPKNTPVVADRHQTRIVPQAPKKSKKDGKDQTVVLRKSSREKRPPNYFHDEQ